MDNKVWNHNFAYSYWIQRHVNNKKKILDVGCGNGYLDFYLCNENNYIIGLDIDISCVCYDKNNQNIKFIQDDFINHNFKNEKYDAILFVASIHHMNHQKALEKAKTLLNNDGIIIIVGLSKPSSILDWIIEILRIIPSKIISKIKKIKTSEDLFLNVNYELPKLGELKKIYKKELKGYKLRYGLHYRYLLYWINK